MKTKMKLQKYFTRILATFMLIVLFFPKLTVLADVSPQEAGKSIASFAIDFYNKYGTRVQWYNVDTTDPNSYSKRASAYNEATVGSMQTYYMDCVGWVSYVVHHATGLDDSGAKDGTGGFVVPGKCGGYFEDVTGGELLPGDILSNSHHVMIYVGNDKLIDSRGNGLTYTTLEEYGNNGNYKRASYGPGTWGVYDNVYRMNASAASGLNPDNLSPIISGTSKSNQKKKKDYNYYGMPTKGEYVGSVSTGTFLKNIVNKLSQIADYLIGVMTLGIKIELIGWTTIFENLFTDMIDKITGSELEGLEETNNTNETQEESTGELGSGVEGETEGNAGEQSTQETGDLYTPNAMETVTGYFTKKMENRLTIEKIIYNEVPIFDINIFNTEEAGGKKLNPDGTLATIKRNIAKWYYVFRNLSIICLLLILLYIGIRMAISTAVEEKILYKRYLKDWLVSFIIVFCIHYVMIFVLDINEYLVGLFKTSMPNQEQTLYETVRTKAYELKFTSGIAGTIMYIYLVYLMIKYLFIYAKRYLTINILAVIAPLIGISYSIDKIKDNKGQSFNAWLTDFTLTSLLQTIHALIYTLFISVALETSEDNIGGTIFAFILLNFMTKADKILMNIFNFKRGKGLTNIIKGDGMKQLMAIFAGTKTVKAFYGTTFNIAKGTIRGVGRVGGLVIPDRIRFGVNDLYNRATEGVLGEDNFLDKRRTNDIKTVSGIDDKIKQKKLEYRGALKKQITGPFKMFKSGITFTAKAAMIAPHLIESPKEGMTRIIQLRGMAMLIGKQAKQNKLISQKTGKGSLNSIIHTHNQNILGKDRGILTPRLAHKNSKDQTMKLQGRYAKSIHMLEQAKALEESIISGYMNIKADSYSRFGGGTLSTSDTSQTQGTYQSGRRQNIPLGNNNTQTSETATGSLPDAIIAKMNTQYNRMVNEIFKEIDETDIQHAVDSFVKDKNTRKITEKDVDELLEMLQANLDKKKNNNIELSDEAAKNIEKTMRNNSDNRIARGIEEELKQNDIDTTKIDIQTQKSIVRDMKKALQKSEDEDTLIKALEQSLTTNNVTISISDNIKRNIVNNLKGKTKREEEKVYTPKEIVKIMKTGLDKKNSIKREEAPSQLKEIAENMEELRELNNNYKKEFGEKIFETEEIIKAMKEARNTKKYDLYDEIINA